MHKPAETDSLHTSFDEVMTNHNFFGCEASVADVADRRKLRRDTNGAAEAARTEWKPCPLPLQAILYA